MTATVTALIELAVDHGFGVAFLVVGGQVLLDRLNPVGYVASLLFGGPKGSAHGAGAHRREREPRPSAASRFASSHRNEPLGCMK